MIFQVAGLEVEVSAAKESIVEIAPVELPSEEVLYLFNCVIKLE